MQADVRSQNFWCGGEVLPKPKWAKPSKWEKKNQAIVKIILCGGGGGEGGRGCSTEEKVDQTMEMYFVECAH